MDGLRGIATSAALLAALTLVGCLGGDEDSPRIQGGTVVVYSSLPRSGVSAPAARAVAAGQRLALDDAGGEAGGLRVKLVELDASEEGEEAPWSPEQISANAEEAADDPKAIAYLGELAYGASAVSLPITNDAGLLQVSPTDTLTSLSQTPIGRPRAGPDRYYPSGSHSFARLVPNDDVLAETLLELGRALGARRMAVLFDGDIYGRELGGQLSALGRRDGPEPVDVEEYRGRVEEIPDVVRSLAEDRPDLVVYAGVAGAGTGRLLAQIDARMPGVPVYGTAGLLARDPRAPIPVAPAAMQALGAVPPPSELPPEGKRLLRRLARTAGQEADRPEALYGYEAMNLVLDAIRTGGPDRDRVRRAGTRIRARRSALGYYRLRRTGDVDTGRLALWTLRDGRFEFERMVE
jgi:branched-chain amino acid transport system substrate-binding protein